MKRFPASRRLFSEYNPARYVRTEQLQEFSERLGAKEFEPVDPSSIPFPIKGIIVGSSTHRLFINLAVTYRALDTTEPKTIWVPFLVSSGSPWNFMSSRTMSALGVIPARETTFRVHGFDDVFMNLSPPGSHFTDINVLGGDFFHHTYVTLCTSYHKR
jgi:hypothetical protein